MKVKNGGKRKSEGVLRRNLKASYKILSCLTALAVLFSSMTVFAAVRTNRLINRVEHSELMFEEYEYVEMKESDFDAIVKDLPDLVEDASKEEEVLQVVKDMEDYYLEVDANSAIASIYSDLEADNEEYDARVEYTDELRTNIVDKIYINYKLVAESVHGEALREYLDDEEEWEYILEYEPMTQEQKDWTKRETELSLEYDVVYNEEYTCTIDGVKYDEETIEEAVSDGTIDYEEYLTGYADIISSRNEALVDIYLELVEIRNNLARSYGYDNYAEYAYEEIYDRDYTPDDLEAYRESVKEYYSPLLTEVLEMYRNDNSVQAETMWDQEVTGEQAQTFVREHLGEVSEDMLESYDFMIEHHLINMDVDENKAPSTYTTTITGQYDSPYIFVCAEGDFSDIGSLIHEFGHYNEMYFAPEHEWHMGGTCLDLAEIHSQGLELIYTEYDDEMFGEYADAVELYNILNQVYVVVEGAKEDYFQCSVYEYEGELDGHVLNQLYYDACEEFQDLDLYNSYYLGMYGVMPANEICEWVDIPHTFQSPMYYISYSVSMAGVEELREELEEDRDQGIEKYLELVYIGCDESYYNALEMAEMNNPIQNPRFDLYAHNIHQLLGIDDDYVDTGDDITGENPDDNPDGNPGEDPDEGDGDDDDEGHHHGHSRLHNNDDSKEGLSDEAIGYIVVGGLSFIALIIVIIIIILIVKRGSRKNAASGNGAMPSGTPVANSAPSTYVNAVPDIMKSPDITPTAPYNAMPNNGTVMPNNGAVMPNNSAYMPNNGGVMPNNGAYMPDNGAVMINNAVPMPDNSMLMTGNKNAEIKNEVKDETNS